jgi:hypothetical protein
VEKLSNKSDWKPNAIHTMLASIVRKRAWHARKDGRGGTKKIPQRIQCIAGFFSDSLLLKWKSKVICAILGIVVLLLAPITTVIASPDDVYQFSGKNVVYEDLSSFFKGKGRLVYIISLINNIKFIIER